MVTRNGMQNITIFVKLVLGVIFEKMVIRNGNKKILQSLSCKNKMLQGCN